MAIGGIAEILLGVRAEQKPLEDIATPLTVEGEGEGEEERADRDRIADRHRERELRQRQGRRRYRLGPGNVSYSPFFGYPAQQRPEWTDVEVDRIAREVGKSGETDTRGLAAAVGRLPVGSGPLPGGASRGDRRGRGGPGRSQPGRAGRPRRLDCGEQGSGGLNARLPPARTRPAVQRRRLDAALELRARLRGGWREDLCLTRTGPTLRRGPRSPRLRGHRQAAAALAAAARARPTRPLRLSWCRARRRGSPRPSAPTGDRP